MNKEINSEQLNNSFSSKSLKRSNKYKIKRKNLNNFLAKNILGEFKKKQILKHYALIL